MTLYPPPSPLQKFATLFNLSIVMLTGTIRFGIPDETVTAEERSFFGSPQNKDYVLQDVKLRDFRTATDVVKGPEGLDVQGFTWLKHHSKIVKSDRLLDDRNLDDIYLPEVKQLILDITGAKRAVVWQGAGRYSLPEHQDKNPLVQQHRKGGDADRMIASLPRDKPLISGRKAEQSIEPLRNAHIDLNNDGLRAVVRNSRKEIRDTGKEALDAEDAGVTAPRYAAYSVWRPLRNVTRDPLAAADWRTVDQAHDLYDERYRIPTDKEPGEFMSTIRMILPPRSPDQLKWYYFSNQTPDDVLILKIGDTASDEDPNIACGAPHVSPRIKELDHVVEPRQSMEIRVIAFW